MPDRHHRPGPDHRRRFAQGAAHAAVRHRGLRQDRVGHGIPGARRHRVRRAGRVHGVRGDGQGLEQNVASLGFDLPALCARKKLFVDYVRVERSEIEETGRVRPGRAVHPPGQRDRCGRRQAGGSGHHRVLVRRVFQHQHLARGTPPPVPLVEGEGRHRRDHRRDRRRQADSSRDRGVRRRLRDSARPSGRGPDFDPPAARHQVPRHHARHQRVSLPDRRNRFVRAPSQFLEAGT